MTTWRPSSRFVAIHGESITRDAADELLARVLVNHDTVPDLVTLAATVASEQGQPVTFAEVAEVAAFDAEGWIDG